MNNAMRSSETVNQSPRFKMPDPRAFKIRQEQEAARKLERDNAQLDFKSAIALSQIAEALFSLRDEVQDIRIAVEAKNSTGT